MPHRTLINLREVYQPEEIGPKWSVMHFKCHPKESLSFLSRLELFQYVLRNRCNRVPPIVPPKA